jgi:exonuclease SbcC
MEILSVTLKNFKAHRDRHFVFQPGTNAICGENGAGKTSILEAIAWTLFNYRGAYKNEDLIYNGAGSTQVTVAFISSRDGRTYEVQRCTSRGYTIYDPQLGERLEYKHIEEEIMPWLRQHLAVAPGTDLGKLFANTIGIPQGTFTADFLLSPEKRKPIFDAVLKVEEYRQVNQDMLSLEKYAKAEVEQLERTIAQYEEALQELVPLYERRMALQQAIAADEAQLLTLRDQLVGLQAEKDKLSAWLQQVRDLETQMHHFKTQLEAKQQAHQILNHTLQRARQALQYCETHQSGYHHFLQTETALKELERQHKQRQGFLKQREQQQKKLTDQHTQMTRLTLQLEHLQQAQAELEQLQPLIHQQTEWEQQQTAIANQLQHLQAAHLEQQTLAKQVTKLQAQHHRLQQDIQRLQGMATITQEIANLEQHRHRLQEQLSHIEAARQFEADLQQLLQEAIAKRDNHQTEAQHALVTLRQMQQSLPLLATASVDAVLAAIQTGMDLNNDLLEKLQQILADLTEQTSAAKLKQHLHQLKLQLETAYRQQAEVATLPDKQEQVLQLQAEMTQLQTRIVHLQAQRSAEADLLEQRSHLTHHLTQLGDPRGRSQLLQKSLDQSPQLQATYTQLQQVQATMQQAIADLDNQLAQFADLDNQLEQQHHIRQLYQTAYLTYLQYQPEASTLPTLEADQQLAIAHLQSLEATYHQLKTDYEAQRQQDDPERVKQVEAAFQEVSSQASRIEGSLPQQQKLLQELDNQWAALQTLAEKRDRARLDLKRRDKIRKFITFARKAYKEAGPRITERYMQSITREADQIFRELMNRSNVTLQWARDYEILVQEGAHTRRFVNLSGGEQMCAALAVRLALLRVLADLDIAFFDEPTTNMDRLRREQLAEAIANIKTFRQLFVISHDDTFEKVTENIILVEREPA